MARLSVLLLVAVVYLPLCGCQFAKSGLAPTASTEPGPVVPLPSATVTTGQTISAVGGGPIGGVTIHVNGSSATSAGDGRFEIDASGGRQTATLSGPGVIDRETGVTMPGPHAVFSLIPSNFDLVAFDQMFRQTARLQRWVSSPQLVVQTRTLTFTSIAETEFVATPDEMSSGEITELLNELTAGLVELGAGHVRFDSVNTETAAPGSRVSVARINKIVVARFSGLQGSGYIGFGRWATTREDNVIGGAVFYDRDFDRAGGGQRHAVRVHELGHGLGYNHVTARASVMNPMPMSMPTPFDKEAASIAYQRQPGNRSPDVDVTGFSTNLIPGGEAIWHPGLK